MSCREMAARLGVEEPGIEVEIVASNQVENLLRRDADIAMRMVKPAQNELVARKVTDMPLMRLRGKDPISSGAAGPRARAISPATT